MTKKFQRVYSRRPSKKTRTTEEEFVLPTDEGEIENIVIEEEHRKSDEKEENSTDREEESEENQEEDEEDEESGEEESEEEISTSERRSKVLHDNNVGPSRSNFDDAFDFEVPECIKSIDPTAYRFATYLSQHGDSSGKIYVKTTLGGKAFIEFRNILQEHDISQRFKESYFGHFLDIPMQQVYFGSQMVRSLLLRRIICEKKIELWIEYKKMPICFSLREFVLMTGLRCHPFPSEKALDSLLKKGERLWKFVSKKGKTINAKFLLELIESSDTPRMFKFSLALVWFVHCIICVRDLSKAVDSDMTKLACNPSVFNKYPWGLKSYMLTIEYLVKPMKAENNLYGFPWAFMAWAFEAIPELQRNVKNDLPERTMPRMIKWMSYGGLKKSADPLNCVDEKDQNDKVVHPFLFPTNAEKREEYMKDLEPFATEKADDKIDMLKVELAGVTTITTGEVVREVGGNKSKEASPPRGGGLERSSPRGAGEERSPQSPLINCGDRDVGSPFDYNFGGQYGEGSVSRGAGSVQVSNVKCACECPMCADKQKQLEERISNMEKEFKDMGQTVKKLVEELSILNKKLEPRRMLKVSKYRRTPFTVSARKTKKRLPADKEDEA